MYDGHDNTGSDTQLPHENLVRMGIARKVYEVRDALRAIDTLLGEHRELTAEQCHRLELASKSIDALVSRNKRTAA